MITLVERDATLTSPSAGKRFVAHPGKQTKATRCRAILSGIVKRD